MLTDAYLASLAELTRVTGQLAAVPAAGASLLRRVRADRPAGFLEWAAEEMRRHDVRMLIDATRSITRFDSRGWIGEIDVPTTVLRTNRDRIVEPARQTEMVDAHPGRPARRARRRPHFVRSDDVRRTDAQRVPRCRVAGQRLTRIG